MFRPATRSTLLALVVAVLTPIAANAQGILIVCPEGRVVPLPRIIYRPPLPTPVPPATYRIKALDVRANIDDQIARVQIAQTYLNTGSQPLEARFMFPLPPDAAIDQLTLMVDGKELPGRLLKATDARQIYEDIVRRSQDPALLEWVSWGLFQTNVFPIPPGAERTVQIRYSQICKKDHGPIECGFPLGAAKYTSEPPESINIQFHIDAPAPIRSIYSPTHTLNIERTGDRTAVAKYSSSRELPTGDLRLFYDTSNSPVGASLISYRPTNGEDGYFLLLATPEVKADKRDKVVKSIELVLDKSGSMEGKKIEQAKNALKYVIERLNDGDLFNIVTYDDKIDTFRPELQRFNSETRQAALAYVESIFAGGSTNIDGALAHTLKQLNPDGSSRPADRPQYVVFLTDGLPTAGEKNEMKIVENVKRLNTTRARLISFGVGYDVNGRLLDGLSRGNFGQSQYVRPDEDIEAHVSKLYKRIASPVMSDVVVTVSVDAPGSSTVNRVYPREVYDLFEGDQLVMVGRYPRSGPASVAIKGRIAGREEQYRFASRLADASSDPSFSFVEKVWASRRIGEIIDEMDLKGKNQELINELVALSTKHGILTPYTSFLADERNDIRAITANAEACKDNLSNLAVVGGASGFAQRESKAAFKNAVAPTSTPAPSAATGGRSVQVYRDYDDKEVQVTTVQNVLNKTLYCRAHGWIDSTVTAEQEKKAVKLVRFSDDYFKLAASNGQLLAQLPLTDRAMFLNLDGTCYRIDPEPAK